MPAADALMPLLMSHIALCSVLLREASWNILSPNHHLLPSVCPSLCAINHVLANLPCCLLISYLAISIPGCIALQLVLSKVAALPCTAQLHSCPRANLFALPLVQPTLCLQVQGEYKITNTAKTPEGKAKQSKGPAPALLLRSDLQ